MRYMMAQRALALLYCLHCISLLSFSRIVHASSLATRTCKLQPLGPGKDDTDQVTRSKIACIETYVVPITYRSREPSPNVDILAKLCLLPATTTSLGMFDAPLGLGAPGKLIDYT